MWLKQLTNELMEPAEWFECRVGSCRSFFEFNEKLKCIELVEELQ